MAHKWQSPFDPESAIVDDSTKTHAVHMALLPRGPLGAVLYFSGNRWDTANHYAGAVDHTALMDYQSRTAVLPGSPVSTGGLAPNNFVDLFCCGHAMMADGRPLVLGGTSQMLIQNVSNPHDGHWGGLRESFIFDATLSPPWRAAALMNASPVMGDNGKGGGRWYPSAVTLSDGTVLALEGHPRIYPQAYDEVSNPADFPAQVDDFRHDNSSPDRYYPNADHWAQLNAANGLGEGFLHDYAVFFPRVHVLPSGKLFIVQPLYTTPGNGSVDQTGQFAGKSLVYDVDAQTVVASFAGPQGIDGGYLITNTLAQFSSSVLLPLTPENNYTPTILICNQVQAARATLNPGQESSATWTPTKPRTAFFNANGPMVVPPRLNAVATLLPTGQVFVSGGMNQYPNNPPAGKSYDQAFGVFVPEIYDPPSDTWTALTDTPATVARGYHSNALLMLDGRVLTAGSETNNVFGAASAEYRMEAFEPDYIAAPNRLTITGTPPCAAYGETFTVNFQLAPGTAFPTISRVAIMRFGSATHAFDYDQRYVGLTFTQTGPGVLSVIGPPNGGVAPPGYYMLWLLDNGKFPCVQAATIRIGGQRVYVETDRSVFSIYDVQFNQDPVNHVATYSRAIALVFDGFIPNEILNLTATGVVMGGTNVAVQFSSPVPIANPAAEAPESPELIQRTIFAFDVVFPDTSAFNSLVGPDGILTLTIKLSAGTWSSTGTIDLVMEPSPFMKDGQPFYLSQDIRVFQVTEATAPNWLPNYNWASPTDYVQKLIAHLNAPTSNGDAMFQQLPTGEQQEALSLLPTADGTQNGPKIFSFAIARVRLDSAVTPAKQTRVLFRLFRTMRPSLVYNTSTIYRRQPKAGTDVIGLLGVEGPDLISIPFFASDRVTPTHDMITQTDPSNLIDLPNGATEQERYFGCWLDINQPTVAHFPASPGLTTDFSQTNPANLRSIQALIGSFHQCVVAEVHYKFDASSPDLPHQGDSPSTSDKLAQRNLALLGAANPGNAATRTVQQSFEIKGPASTVLRPASDTTTHAAVREIPGIDALVLWWGNLPKGSVVDVYLPGVRARDVLALNPPPYAPIWRVLDDHTLRCAVPGDVAFLPLPPAVRDRALSGLLTMRLPRGIRHGQTFRVIGQQYTRQRTIVGAFQVSVQVSADHASLIIDDKDQLAILKHNLSLMSGADRWRPIQERMIAQLSERLEGFDVDPGSVAPSPWGAGPHRPALGGTISRYDDDDRALRFIGEAILPLNADVEIDIEAKIRIRSRDIP
jgi:hypothetical protein